MVEMKDSGIRWIGQIPSNWNIVRVKDAFIRKKAKAKQDDPIVLSLARSGVKVRDISNNEGQLAENYTDYNPVTVDDLLLNPMDLISGDNCNISRVEGVISPAYVNLRYKDGVNPEFYNFYFKYQYWCKAFFAHGKGVSFENRWTLNSDTLERFPIVLPPIEEQNKIAAFLVKKCSEIDDLYSTIEHQIETLEEYKKSIITEAVTKGLDQDAEMKDSGIEWIGNIPKDWSTIRIGHAFSLRNERNSLPEDQVQLLSLYTGIGVFPQGEHVTASGNHAQTVDGYKIVHKNDIVVNIILAWMGAIGVSDYDGVTSPAYDVYIPDLSKVVPHYFHYVFRTSGIAGECYKYGRGIMMMRWRTYSQEFKQICVPFPSLIKQQEIADYLDKKCAEIDSVIADKQQQIETLEQYKKSLIYEYVTGKKEVPDNE